jgi:DNA-binding PadR family transcriptional regulator
MGIGITLMAFIITYLAWRNGKIIKENTAVIINKMDEEFRELRKEIRELGEKIDQGFRRMDEGLRLIALLILAETPEEKKDIAKKILEDIGKK